MSKFKFIKKGLKYAGIGAASGYVGAAVTAPGFTRSSESKTGLKVGAMVGTAAGVTGSIIGKLASRRLRKVSRTAKVVFRRIRGKIVPIRKK